MHVFSFILLAALHGWMMGGQHQAAPIPRRIVVDINGHGEFVSVQDAVNSIKDSSGSVTTIFIKRGVYREKIFIEKNNIVFDGEDSATTVITQAIARDAWRCEHVDDWGVATMNIRGNDITLKNLTITNSYGFDRRTDTTIACRLDASHTKSISPNGHQMALRTMNNTRLRAIHCRFAAWAGDTVSPWNTEGGMFYFQNCTMEGGVDFYCPRGWAYADHCRFIAHTGAACIWHDGTGHEDAKTVLVNCSFGGYDGFKLGRYHRDAQFYLVNCMFDENMADQDIYKVATDNKIVWGRRVYYFHCHKNGPAFNWYADNLLTAPGSPLASQITASWVFDNKWNPAE